MVDPTPGAMPPTSSSISTTTQTEEVLNLVRKELWKIQLPQFLDPFREFVLDPSIQFWTILLPPLVTYYSFQGTADTIIATFITYTTLGPVRVVLCISTALVNIFHKQSTELEDLRRASRRQLLSSGLPPPARLKPPSEYASSLRGMFAFLFSATSDLMGAMLHPRKMKAWVDAIANFRNYVHTSRVGQDLEEAMMKPLYAGRLFDNIKMLHDIQEMQDAERVQRIQLESSSVTEAPRATASNGLDHSDMQIPSAMMRYATAAYGTEMVKSAIDDEVDATRIENERQAIAFHTRIPQEDIKLLKVREKDFNGIDSGGTTTSHLCLRHFVAVDHKRKAIVLALRGTLSISGALVDIQAMDVPYCTGRAHKGIAETADAVWQESGAFLIDLLNEEMYANYDFIIIGHSLGAGTACLLHMKVHVQGLIDFTRRRILCFGFAPPPTFSWDPSNANISAIERAIQHCVCYMHDNDCVPHLSVATIRRLAILLDAVDNYNEKVWFWTRALIFWGWKRVPKGLIDVVIRTQKDFEGKTARFKDCDMIIPAKVVIWCKKVNEVYKIIPCCPRAISELNVYMCEDMVADHLPEQYEDSFDSILQALTPIDITNLINE